jgi:hypothetical protein
MSQPCGAETSPASTSSAGSNVSLIIPWAISYLNGMKVVGLLFGSGYRLLPGRHGITKGLSVGVLVWLIIFFPLVGLAFFAFDVGLGFQPTLFSLTMVDTYSAVMGQFSRSLTAKRQLTERQVELLG